MADRPRGIDRRARCVEGGHEVKQRQLRVVLAIAVALNGIALLVWYLRQG
ncbi:hypothetical protein FHS42_004233 [Streptomyces zagrosensis]|uniref:Uncharacterized protein n=1 Tax=Streptomyces zagrosensis TaxID=1042984 RepID=A0A7W9V0W1_9ACTN|nr:hypothetical protein [Streptomyces zagrosensis]